MNVLSKIFKRKKRRVIKIELPTKEVIKYLHELNIDVATEYVQEFMRILDSELEKIEKED